ncbi:hypothetical protein C6361_29625 [Plantactinospora sp. BC1]|uniref:hypothetical protein n=1 Tax=Plantactinospora sp. BC1 TaxID=2108470 RepID=UPI000D16727A|nr:hypothetical protein [Plantactinospora sp. BC1]AVT32937.1 hypothetical protein C6361_29625 [Plantactinospora sp. BC1]
MSVADDLHTISFPVDVRPSAPLGEQNAPGLTPIRTAGDGFLVVFFGFGLAVVIRGVGLLVVLAGTGAAVAGRVGVAVAPPVGLVVACWVAPVATPCAPDGWPLVGVSSLRALSIAPMALRPPQQMRSTKTANPAPLLAKFFLVTCWSVAATLIDGYRMISFGAVGRLSTHTG